MDQDLIAYLDKRFASLEQRVGDQVQTLREETAQGFSSVERQVQAFRDETQQKFSGVDQRLDNLETDVRRAYVAIEDLRDDVRLVAEGVTNVNERLDRHEENTSQRFTDLESLLRHSYEDLDTRVRKLEGFG